VTGNDGDRLVALDDGKGRGLAINRLVNQTFEAFRVGDNRFGEFEWQADQSVAPTVRRLEPIDEYNGEQ
jgi:hypothetical protein